MITLVTRSWLDVCDEWLFDLNLLVNELFSYESVPYSIFFFHLTYMLRNNIVKKMSCFNKTCFIDAK